MSETAEFTSGYCKYCEQQISITSINKQCENEEEADAAATLLCDCPDAVKNRSFNKAQQEADKLFDNSETSEMVKQFISDIHHDRVLSITCQIDQETKVRVNKTTKDKLKIKKTTTEAQNIIA